MNRTIKLQLIKKFLPWILGIIYVISPIDIIPDFIPVLGYLDDLILLPMGIAAVVALIPKEVMADLRRQAEERVLTRPRSWLGALIIILLWLVVAVFLVRWFYKP